jgi:iron complex outermembrane recepter protein
MKRVLSIVAILAIQAVPGVVFAAEGDSAAQPAPSQGLEEILVTAEKRTTNLQDTPVSATVFSTEDIAENRIVAFQDLALRTPGLSYAQLSKGESYFSIRGTLMNTVGAGWDDAVTVFVDGVPETGVADNSPDLFDLASIEVLRGPQGTLFGRNSTGGAVVLHTLLPSFTPGGEIEVTYGNYNLSEVNALVTGPLAGDQLAGKLAVHGLYSDGDIRNVTLGDNTYGNRQGGLRGQLLWQPNDDLKVLFGAEFHRDTGSGKVAQLVGNFMPSIYPNITFNPYETNQGRNSQTDKTTGDALLRADWKLPWATITSITGYRHVDNAQGRDRFVQPELQYQSNESNRDNQLTEEIHLTSPDNQTFRWVAGTFLMRGEKKEDDLLIRRFGGDSVAFVNGPWGPGGPWVGSTSYEEQVQEVVDHNYALFGQGEYSFTEKWQLTVGLRYTYEEKTGTSGDFITSPYVPTNPAAVAPYNALFNPGPAVANYSQSWNALTPKYSLSYKALPGLLMYATYAKGFKSGGYDMSAVGTGVPIPAEIKLMSTPFAPEIANSYEIGSKLTTFNNHLRINASVYQVDYRDLQTQQYDPVTTLAHTTNAGSARVKGGELSIEAAVASWLTLGLSSAYTDAKYTDYVLLQPGQPAVSYTGHRMPTTPLQFWNGFAETNWPVSGGSHLNVGGDLTFHSMEYVRDDNVQPDFLSRLTTVGGLLNAHVRWINAKGDLTISLWGKNLTDVYSVQLAAPLTPFFATPAEFANRNNQIWEVAGQQPLRSYGISAMYKF